MSPFTDRVKSGIHVFGQTAKFGQRPCLFHISNIGIKNENLDSGLTRFANVCPNLPDVRIYPTLP